ncbi:MAG: heavy metal translocating P-type ATPase [Alphaproteobacteria bacterium]|nr:heavy metal translocating P-type ATPase [Alphaproteobacteria bacterium]
MLHVPGLMIYGGAIAATWLWRQLHEDAPAPGPEPADAPEVSLKTDQLVEDDAELDHYLKVSTVGLAASVVGAAGLPVIGTLNLAILGYAALPILEDAYVSLVRQRRFHISQLDILNFSIGVGAGVYVLSALGNVAYFSALKLLSRTRDHSRQGVIDIFGDLQPTAWVVRDGVELEVAVSALEVGDLVALSVGESVPVDGVIVSGEASIDEHILTGEAQPAERGLGEPVLAGTLVLSGRPVVRVTRAGAETIAAQITQVLNSTEDYHGALQDRCERWANRTVQPTLVGAGVTLIVLGPAVTATFLSSNFSELARLSSPLTMLAVLQVATERKLLVKDGRSFEALPSLKAVVFDKTGTLTLTRTQVADVRACAGASVEEVLGLAAAAEHRQAHPIAQAIVAAAEARGLQWAPAEASYRVGFGVEVELDGAKVLVGSLRLMRESQVALPAELAPWITEAEGAGRSLVFVARGGEVLGVIELRATTRPEAAEVVRELQARGLQVFILSGDREAPVAQLARELGVDGHYAQALPGDKADIVRALQEEVGPVCFVGDGINDSIAMKTAAVSVSLAEASEVAIGAAQVVLIERDLTQLLDLLDLGAELERNQTLTLTTIGAPSVASAVGALLLGFSVATSLALFQVAVVASVASASLPLLRERYGGASRGRRRSAEPAAI